jgi:beta-galactosidase
MLKNILLVMLFTFIMHVTKGQGREVINFNAGWKFILDDNLQYRHTSFDDTKWKKLNLPHDWSIGFDFAEHYPAGNAGGALPGGIGWYRKTFDLEKKDINKSVFIYFGGVYRYAEVWINGIYLGKNYNGYLSFEKELTKYLNYGDKSNVIAIRADNSLQPNSRWYSGSGIYRDVKLEKRHKSYLLKNETILTTPIVDVSQSTLNVSSKIFGQGELVKIELSDKNNKLLAQQEVRVKNEQIEASLNINSTILWSPENPYLYQVKISLLNNKKEKLDDLTYSIGFRHFKFEVNEGFELNGVKTKILGVCLHHDLGALGAAFNKSAAKRQLVIMKEMGVNAIRTAHNPPAEELLDLCDEMGFLVYNEAYDMWKKRKNKFDYHIDFDEHHIADLENFVKRDRNRTSVFMWSIGNEIREQFDATGTTLTKSMTKTVRELDPTRPVTAALTETDYAKNFIAQAETLDVLGFNYKYFDYDKLKTEFINTALLASETTSALQTRGVYQQPQDTIQLWPASSKDKYVTNGNMDFTVSAYDNVAAYWGTSHERAWLEVKKRDFLSGIFVWTGIDYLGEPVPYPYPARSSYYGIVDLSGLPKDVYYMYQSEWTKKEVLHLMPHWNWKKGDNVAVWCYYNNADYVELFLNGKSLGKSTKSDESLHAEWKVPFELGELKVVKYRDGKIVQEEFRHTAGEVANVHLEVEHDKYAAGDATDLYFITVSLRDDKGNIVTDNDLEIEFSADNNCAVLGTDNGYQADLQGLTRPIRKTFKGYAVGYIMKNDIKNAAALTIKSKLGSKTIQL